MEKSTNKLALMKRGSITINSSNLENGRVEIELSEDGNVWKDLQTVDGESVNTITFAEPIHTRYIKMQGVSLNGNNTFKLREFEAYEAVDKTALKEQVKAAEEKCEEFGLTFADAKGYDAFMDAY